MVSNRPFLQQITALLEKEHTDIDFDYSRLCHLLGRSRSQVYRQFQADNLGTPSAYIRTFRLERAAELLTNTDFRISEIAFNVGFKSASHFSAAFVDCYGESPKAYRLNNKNEFS